MSHLLRRLARLVLCLPQPSIKDIDRAIECLNVAHFTLREWNNEESRPVSLAILLEKVGAHIRALFLLSSDTGAWAKSPMGLAHLDQAKETLRIAREDADDLFGKEGAVLKDMVETLGKTIVNFETKMGSVKG